jgi:hypothetical protein
MAQRIGEIMFNFVDGYNIKMSDNYYDSYEEPSLLRR